MFRRNEHLDPKNWNIAKLVTANFEHFRFDIIQKVWKPEQNTEVIFEN